MSKQLTIKKQYTPYDHYTDSGVAWLGQVPEGWSAKQLKRVLKSNDGGTWGEEGAEENGTAVLRSTEIDVDGKWTIEDPEYRILNPKEREKTFLKEGDLLLTKSSGSKLHLGKTALVTKEIEKQKYSYSNFMQRLKVNENDILPKFVYYLLNFNIGREQINYWGMTTSGLVNLNRDLINSFTFPIPSLPTQKRIAAYLDEKTEKIDKIIDNKKKLAEFLEEKKKAIITKAVTKGLDKDVKMKDSGVEWLGQVPEGWKVISLFKYSDKIGSGTTPTSTKEENFDENGVPWVNTGDLNDSQLLETKKRVSKIAIINHGLKLYKKGSLIIAMYGATIGKLSILGMNATVNQACCVIEPGKKIDTKYLFYYLLGERKEIINMSYGGGQPNISQDLVKKLPILIPPITTQQEIVACLDQKTNEIDNTIKKVKQSIHLLTEYKSSLISHVVTGRVKV